ncbi:hypothetical protein [Nocardia brasiliensis]|uniref:hypothetical protein n=1 Tax=Nocardia brasiliensis TaxID=37326 RepID=UPI00245774DD|nr:hypothetical protein [Nocardia brasiliensis]
MMAGTTDNRRPRFFFRQKIIRDTALCAPVTARARGEIEPIMHANGTAHVQTVTSDEIVSCAGQQVAEAVRVSVDGQRHHDPAAGRDLNGMAAGRVA